MHYSNETLLFHDYLFVIDFSFGLVVFGFLLFNVGRVYNGLNVVGPSAKLLSLGILFSLKKQKKKK